jgi:hypothetical protein
MTDPNILQSFFLIFSGAALVATLALYTRQPMLIALYCARLFGGALRYRSGGRHRAAGRYRRNRHYFSALFGRV